MAEVFLLLLVLLLGGGLSLLWSQVSLLRLRIEKLETMGFDPQTTPRELEVEPEPEPEPIRQPARIAAKVTGRRGAVVTTDVAAPLPPEPEAPEHRDDPQHEETPPTKPGANFENLVGGKLPIWVGGISLVFAGFFLVRFTIEAGLLGPGARSIIATLFALLMIAGSEFGGRLPKVGDAFKADPRVGQALAGAGVAVLYGTLYMASEIYGLVVLPTSFLLMIVVTAIAFALSLRHGPPTALMGLVGGFLAPWVAGMGADNISALLLYLAVFIAALFGLAIWRRWLWLLALASGGGAIWSLALLFTASTALPLLGIFILFSGAAALLALYRFDGDQAGWAQIARYLPIAMALVQLAILLPRMQFSPTGWLFYAALSILAIATAWRDRKMIAAVAGALLLSMVPLASGWFEMPGGAGIIYASFGIPLLFGGASLAAMSKPGTEAKAWALIALAAPLLSWCVSAAGTSQVARTDWNIWGALGLLAAAPCAWVAWSWHKREQDSKALVQAAATAATAFMMGAALICWIDSYWAASIMAVIALGIAAWARVTQTVGDRRLAIIPVILATIAIAARSDGFLTAFGASIGGTHVLLDLLPSVSHAARFTLVPALLILAITWPRLFALGARTRMACFVIGGAGLLAFLWLLAKQPAGILTPADFIRLGFAERAIFTQALFAGGWLAFQRGKAHPDWPSLAMLGKALCAIAVARFIWFDLLILNPTLVAQSMGPVPVANLGTVHTGLVAIWLWLIARGPAVKNPLLLQIGSLAAVIASVLVTVRQAVQGNLISGGYIDTGENYLYSAALLGLSLIWLVRGLTGGARMLRLAGLGLLTAVTLKVFLIDAAALTGVLRILSFLGLGLALIGIGWAYGRMISLDNQPKAG